MHHHGPDGLIFTPDILSGGPAVLKLTRCTFTDTQVQITDSYLALANSTFTNTTASVLRGYTRLIGTNRMNGSPLAITREISQAVQPMYVDGVVASNVSTGSGLSLSGGNYLLGPSNLLQGNLYPVDVDGGLLAIRDSADRQTSTTSSGLTAARADRSHAGPTWACPISSTGR